MGLRYRGARVRQNACRHRAQLQYQADDDCTASNMKSVSMLEGVDRLMLTTVRLTSFFDKQELGHATGFFYHGRLDGKPNYWLVTNWHVVSGRNALDPTVCLNRKTGAVPNRLQLRLILAAATPEYAANAHQRQLLMQEQSVQLYDNEGRAIWKQHRLKNEIDIAVINCAGGVTKNRYQVVGANEAAQQNDMAIEIGNDVFILGYPLGFSHFLETPIWKKGSIASEPNFETLDTKGRIIIDATTRAGMSGAPVFMRAKTHYVSENGEIKAHVNATRLIGIYASRPNLKSQGDDVEEDRRAEVGYVYKSGHIHDTIVNGIRGPDFGCLPT